MFALKNKKGRRLRALALVWTCLLALFAGLMGAAPERAVAATPVNYGNPFENGDFQANHNEGYRVAGVRFWCDGTVQAGTALGPFDYPENLIRLSRTQIQELGVSGYGSWGVSDFILKHFYMSQNSRGLKFSTMFENASDVTAHCVQHDNPTAHNIARSGRLYLYENKSYWELDGSVYHGVFYVQMANTGGMGLVDQYGYDQSTVVRQLIYADWVVYGKIKLVKSSANERLSQGNPLYRLEGATYGIYSDEAATNKVGELSCDASGVSAEAELSPGTYYIKETKRPSGYALSTQVKQVVVEAGKTTDVSFTDEPCYNEVGLVLAKVDAETGEGAPQGSATLKDAQFKVSFYQGHYGANNLPSKPTRSWVVKTDADGTAKLDKAHLVSGDEFYRNAANKIVFPLGTIVVQEVQAPEGYLLNKDLFIQTISDDTETNPALNLYAPPTVPNHVIRGDLALQKLDEFFDKEASGDGSLAGAVFEIINESSQAVRNAEGELVPNGGVVCSIETNEQGYAQTTGRALAYGDYSVHEASAPEGYLLNKHWTYAFSIRTDGELHKAKQACSNAPMRGRVVLGKIDRENNSYTPQGSASLAGAVFEIRNDSLHAVELGGEAFEPGAVVCRISTELVDGKYVATTPERTLPYGTYTATEVESPSGYLLDDVSKAWSQTFEIRNDGQLCDLSAVEDTVSNYVIRGDLSFNKVAVPSMHRLAGVPFLVRSQTTGEQHIIVTDRNGEAGTALVPHSQKTNANDEALKEDGTIDESKLDDEAGVWFDGLSEPALLTDERGALPFDTYTLIELPVEANKGMKLVEFTVSMYRPGTIDGGTVDDEGPELEEPQPQTEEPRIGTTATDKATGTHYASASADTVMVDQVEFFNFEPGQSYTLRGRAMNAATGEELGIEASKTFVAEASSGSVELEFPADTSTMAGTSIVFFEAAYVNDKPEPVAVHEDLKYEGQTVHVVEPKTPVPDKESEPKGKSSIQKAVAKTGDYIYAHPFISLALFSGIATGISWRVTHARRRAVRKRSLS